MNMSINKVLQFLNITESEITHMHERWTDYKVKKDNHGNRLLKDTTLTVEELDQKMEAIAQQQYELFKLWYETNRELSDNFHPHFTRAGTISKTVVNFRNFIQLGEDIRNTN